MGRSTVGAAVGVGETTQVVFLGNLSTETLSTLGGEPAQTPPGASSQCAFPCLPVSDPHDGTEIFHEDLPVPDAAGLRAARNGFDHVRDQVLSGEQYDLHLGKKIGHILSAPINFSIPFLASESFDFL